MSSTHLLPLCPILCLYRTPSDSVKRLHSSRLRPVRQLRDSFCWILFCFVTQLICSLFFLGHRHEQWLQRLFFMFPIGFWSFFFPSCRNLSFIIFFTIFVSAVFKIRDSIFSFMSFRPGCCLVWPLFTPQSVPFFKNDSEFLRGLLEQHILVAVFDPSRFSTLWFPPFLSPRNPTAQNGNESSALTRSCRPSFFSSSSLCHLAIARPPFSSPLVLILQFEVALCLFTFSGFFFQRCFFLTCNSSRCFRSFPLSAEITLSVFHFQTPALFFLLRPEGVLPLTCSKVYVSLR